jgi:hypothetical protein
MRGERIKMKIVISKTKRMDVLFRRGKKIKK